MRRLLRPFAFFLVPLALALPQPARAQQASGVKEFLRLAPKDIKWVEDSDGSGVQRATLFGDPTKPGIYVQRIRFPRGVMSLPHYHAEDRHLIVISGTWYTGTGPDFAPDKTIPLGPGSYMFHPAGEVHFDGAKEGPVELQVIGYGPSSTVRLKPELGNMGRSLPK